MFFPTHMTQRPCYVCKRETGHGVGFASLFLEHAGQSHDTLPLICERCLFRAVTGEARDYTPFMQQRMLQPLPVRRSWWTRASLWLGSVLHG